MRLILWFEVSNKVKYHIQGYLFYNTTIFWNLQIYYLK